MSIRKTVVLSQHEPAPLSFRLPLGMDTQLILTFYQQDGNVSDTDLASQLQLTGRSTGRTAVYPLPATDVVNGRATAYIPGDDLSDPNGWRLRLLGTVNGEPMLLAVGSVMPIAASGFMDTPADVIDQINLTFDYNQPVELDVSVWKDTTKGAEYDLATTQIVARLYDMKGGQIIMPFTVTVVDANTVRLSLTADQVNVLPASCWWDMTASTTGGATTIAQGAVSIAGTVIPPLSTTTATWDYQKPPTSVNPISGQIIHSNIEQNLLKVSIYSTLSVNMDPTLSLLRLGDEIVIGGTTWTVDVLRLFNSWYEIKVSPVAQDAVSGVTPVTFRRP